MLKIYGRRTSGNVMLPLWAAAEMGMPYEQIDVGGPFGGNDQPGYLAMNPNGLIPTIDDDGFLLWESGAVTRYLCARYGEGTLCPSDPQERALADQWMDWKQTTVMPMMTPIFIGYVRQSAKDRNNERIDRAIKRGYDIWSILDRHLDGRDYILGETFTMADIPLGPQIHRWKQLVEGGPEMKNLSAWYGRLQERPAFREHCMIPLA